MSIAADLVRAVPYHLHRSYCPKGRVPFVVIFLPRTGSNLLAGMLDSHPQIICHHEIFNVDSIHRSLSYKDSDLSFGTVKERDRDPYSFLRRVFDFSEGQTAVGFKIAPGQNDAVLLSLLLARQVRKVLLERRSWLHAFTSAAIAERTHVWSVSNTGGAPTSSPSAKVRVDIEDLRRFVRKRRFFYTLTRTILSATGQRSHTIEYDEIGNRDRVRELLAFLGVTSDAALEARTVRQNPVRLADRIENYAELRAQLAGTPLGRDLDPTES